MRSTIDTGSGGSASVTSSDERSDEMYGPDGTRSVVGKVGDDEEEEGGVGEVGSGGEVSGGAGLGSEGEVEGEGDGSDGGSPCAHSQSAGQLGRHCE